MIVEDSVAADVRGHDEDRVLEVDGAALTVGQAAVVEDLQEHVEHIGRGLLDLVEEDHAERFAAHGFRELAAFVVADVSRRRTDEARDRMLLAIFRHVDADQRLLIVEEILGERTRELGLADARRPEEDKRADRPIRIRESAARTDDGFGDRDDRFVLADDTLVELVVELEELLHLALEQLRDGDARPARDDARDVVFVNFFFEQARAGIARKLRFRGGERTLELGELAVA